MRCQEIGELLPDYLQGNLNSEKHNAVQEHIDHCAECGEEVAIWNKLSVLPADEPSSGLRQRFEAMLRGYVSGGAGLAAAEYRPSLLSVFHWLRSPVSAVALSLLSLVLLAIGAYIGARVSGGNSHSRELAALHSELTNMRQLVVLLMLQQQSASGRLEGVTWTRGEDHLDPQVLSALMHTLRYDSSVDVRLAALDALSRHAGQPQVRRDVINALQEQQSPLVQVALIDLLLEWRDPQAVQRLHKLQQRPNLNPTVRQRAEWAISKLN